MDAFSVCVAAGAKLKKLNAGHWFRFPFHFGLFQFLMPLAGYFGGVLVADLISTFDHWIAFGLLALVGINMIREGLHGKETEDSLKVSDPSKGWSLVMLSVATSIDAAAIGFSLAAVGVSIWMPAGITGIICAVCSAAGLATGSKAGKLLGTKAEIFGGTVLILIGIKILAEHTGIL